MGRSSKGSGGLGEFFSLNGARAGAPRFDSIRGAANRLLAVSDQKAEAADALWTQGMQAEGLQLASLAWRALSSALDEGGRAIGVSGKRSEIARALDLSPGLASKIDSIDTELATTQLPELDAEVNDGLRALYRRVITTRDKLSRALVHRYASVDELGRQRTLRWVWTVLGIALSAAVLGWVLKPPAAITVVSSHPDRPDHGSKDAIIDGKLDTTWILPDHTPGWVELKFRGPRAVRQIRITNGAHTLNKDRGVEAYEVDVMAGTRVLKTISARFTGASTAETQTHPLNFGGVTSIKIRANTFRQYGASLAEVAVD